MDSEILKNADNSFNLDPIRCSEIVAPYFLCFPVASVKIRPPEESTQAQDQLESEAGKAYLVQDDLDVSMGDRQSDDSADVGDITYDVWSGSGAYVVRRHR